MSQYCGDCRAPMNMQHEENCPIWLENPPNPWANHKDLSGTTREELLEVCLHKVYIHTKTGARYKVTDVVWQGDLDLWGIQHYEKGTRPHRGNPLLVRNHLDFFGFLNFDGEPRFTEEKSSAVVG